MDSLSAVKKMVDIVKHSVYSMVYKVKFMLDHSKIIVENVSKYLHYDKLVVGLSAEKGVRYGITKPNGITKSKDIAKSNGFTTK